MKVAWLTDIHLNLVSDEAIRKFRREISNGSPGAVLISGDIAEAQSLERYVMLLGSASSGKAYQARYALSGLVGFCGLLGGALSRLPSKSRMPLAAAVLTLSAWADGQWYFASRYWKDDSRAVVVWLAKVLPSGSTVLTAPNYVAGVLSYYATLQHAPVRMVGVDSVVWESAHPAALMLTRLHHVDDPELLRSRFRDLAASELSEDTVGGYQILMRTEGIAGPHSR